MNSGSNKILRSDALIAEKNISHHICKEENCLTVFFDDQNMRISFDSLKNLHKQMVLKKHICTKKITTVLDTLVIDERYYYIAINRKGSLVLTPKLKRLFGLYVKSFFESGSISNGVITLTHQTYVVSTKKVKIDEAYLTVADVRVADIKDLATSKKPFDCLEDAMSSINTRQETKVAFDDIYKNNAIGAASPIKIVLRIGNCLLTYRMKINEEHESSKLNYLPINSFRHNNKIIIVRGSSGGNITLLKRELEEVEKTLKFRLYESKIFQKTLESISNFYKNVICKHKIINIYFEKESKKAEEGTWELFQRALKSSEKSLNFFILEYGSDDWKRLKGEKNLIRKYSLRYYIVVYAAHNVISTETITHVHIKRSANRILSTSIFKKRNVFLGHGIIFLRNISNSSYVKGNLCEPDLRIVNSHAEREVVAKQLRIDKSKLLLTGIPMFDVMNHNSIDKNTTDLIAIMLTSKSFESHLIDSFEQSDYYQSVMKVYSVATKVVNESKVVIIPHPLFKKHMLRTSLKDSVYTGKISEILPKVKLLISDYSSIVYASFYQGTGILFWHEDLEKCEAQYGSLIPSDDEYIGHRCFTEAELRNCLESGIINGIINLDYFRRQEFIKNYQSINEFNDGKNISRIYAELEKREIV